MKILACKTSRIFILWMYVDFIYLIFQRNYIYGETWNIKMNCIKYYNYIIKCLVNKKKLYINWWLEALFFIHFHFFICSSEDRFGGVGEGTILCLLSSWDGLDGTQDTCTWFDGFEVTHFPFPHLPIIQLNSDDEKTKIVLSNEKYLYEKILISLVLLIKNMKKLIT